MTYSKNEQLANQKPRQKARTAKKDREFDAAKKLRDGEPCFVCGELAVTLHHLKPRSQGGDNSEDNLLSVCNFCHSEIHAAPEFARDNGYLK